MPRTPKECRLQFGPHNCCLYDCPPDDPDHIHICFADDFDSSEGDVVRLRLGLMTEEEFNRRGADRAVARRTKGTYVSADELQRRSYQVAMMNRFEKGLQYE